MAIVTVVEAMEVAVMATADLVVVDLAALSMARVGWADGACWMRSGGWASGGDG